MLITLKSNDYYKKITEIESVTGFDVDWSETNINPDFSIILRDTSGQMYCAKFADIEETVIDIHPYITDRKSAQQWADGRIQRSHISITTGLAI